MYTLTSMLVGVGVILGPMIGRSHRRIATVLFVDVVESTSIASDVGDRRWRELVDNFRAIVRRQLRAFQGREQDTAGDGFFARFDVPANAIRAGVAICSEVQRLGLDVRCGVHTGELETIDGRLGGIAAHIGARVSSLAGPAQVLTTSTSRDLAVGSGIAFDTVGEVELKGVPGHWMLHRVGAVDGVPIGQPLKPEEAANRRASGSPSLAERRRPFLLASIVTGVAVLGMVWASSLVAPSTSPSPTPSMTSPVAASGSPAQTTSPETNHPVALVRIDPSTSRVDDVVRDEHALPGLNHLIVVAGNLWQVYEREVVRRDMETGRYDISFELPPQTWGRVSHGFGSLWFGHEFPVGVIDRIDPTSGRLTAQIEPGVELWDITVGDTAVYLLQTGSRLLEIDPLTNEVSDSYPTGTQTEPVYVGFDDGLLWLSESGANRISLFDPTTREVVRTLEGPQVGLGAGFRDPSGTIWVGDRRNRTVTPYDGDTLLPGAPIGLEGPPHAIAFGFSSVWVAAGSHVYRIGSGTVVSRIEMPDGAYAGSLGIDEATGRLWVASCHKANCDDPL